MEDLFRLKRTGDTQWVITRIPSKPSGEVGAAKKICCVACSVNESRSVAEATVESLQWLHDALPFAASEGSMKG
jgi:hypothetical protein